VKVIAARAQPPGPHAASGGHGREQRDAGPRRRGHGRRGSDAAEGVHGSPAAATGARGAARRPRAVLRPLSVPLGEVLVPCVWLAASAPPVASQKGPQGTTRALRHGRPVRELICGWRGGAAA